MSITYSDELKSRQDSRQSTPIELIDVYMGLQTEVDNNTLFFNDSNTGVEFWPFRGGDKKNYVALGIQRNSVTAYMEGQIESVNVTLDNVSRTFSTLFTQHDLRGKRVVIRRVYADHLLSSGDCELVFDGIIDTPEMSIEDGVRVELKPSIQDSLTYLIPKQMYQVCCNNRFVDEYCANTEAIGSKTSLELLQERTGMTIDTVLDSINFKDSALLSEKVDDYNPCIIKITAGNASNISQRRPAKVSGDLVTLEHAFPASLNIGDEYTIQRDCAKEYWKDCKDRFGNQDNYRGFKTLPRQIVIR